MTGLTQTPSSYATLTGKLLGVLIATRTEFVEFVGTVVTLRDAIDVLLRLTTVSLTVSLSTGTQCTEVPSRDAARIPATVS